MYYPIQYSNKHKEQAKQASKQYVCVSYMGKHNIVTRSLKLWIQFSDPIKYKVFSPSHMWQNGWLTHHILISFFEENVLWGVRAMFHIISLHFHYIAVCIYTLVTYKTPNHLCRDSLGHNMCTVSIWMCSVCRVYVYTILYIYESISYTCGIM